MEVEIKNDSNNMVTVVTQQEWNVLKKDTQVFNKQELNSILYSINQLNGGNHYMIDYYRHSIVADTDSAWILGGYPKEIAENEGFCFFKRILSKEEWIWLERVNQESYKLLFNHTKDERRDLMLNIDLTITSVHGEKQVLHHKITPFKLCSNGNMWISLCKVSRSHHQAASKTAYIINTKTGSKYNFIENTFVSATNNTNLTPREVKVLTWIIQEKTEEYMSAELDVSISRIKQVKKHIYHKLGVTMAPSAIHVANAKGIL
jgi:DNA-binding CsgD family transcriptional regulator